MLLSSPADVLLKTPSLKKTLRIPQECQPVWIQIKPDDWLGLISVQIVLRLSADDILLLAKKPVEPGTLL